MERPSLVSHDAERRQGPGRLHARPLQKFQPQVVEVIAKKKMSVSKNDSSQLTVANPSKLILHQQGVMKRIVPSYPRQNTQQKCVNLLGSQGLVWTRFFCQLTRLALPAFGGIFRSGEECGKKLFLRTSSIVKQEKPTSLSRCGGTVFGTLYFMILYILFWINKT